jgi:hypothetical protein
MSLARALCQSSTSPDATDGVLWTGAAPYPCRPISQILDRDARRSEAPASPKSPPCGV